jgi:TonB-dependent SusC/RagA subfamily outer membrane receptor
MPTFRFLTLCAIATLVAAFRFADDDFVNRLIAKVNAYRLHLPSEKVYLQTDRDTYLPGETIWLSGSLFDGATHLSDSVSAVLYVELIDTKSRRRTLYGQFRATGGHAPGQLALPDSLPSGTYRLRAFTGWMRNFSPDYFFTKDLLVLNPKAASSSSVTAPVASAATTTPTGAPSRPDVQFLPEGGQLVAGLQGRVAIKAVAPNGRGINVEGFVVNARNDTITGFSTSWLGMGTLNIIPEAGQTYTAIIPQPGSASIRIKLPDSQPVGYVLSVDNLSKAATIRVYILGNKPAATGELTLVAQTRGQIVQVAKVPAGRPRVLVSLPRTAFPEGVAHLTLFDETQKPICERLVFVDRNNRLTVSINPAKPTVKPREKITLNVMATDSVGQPMQGAFALAVTDANQTTAPDTNGVSLPNYLLLSSDLTGAIEQPGAYFDTRDPNRQQRLDVLLMTQGWRRFRWADVLQDSLAPPKYVVETGLSLTGRVTRQGTQRSVGKANLTFMFTRRDSSRAFLMGETNDAGEFAAYDLDLTDTTSLLIQAVRGKNDRILSISLDQLLNPGVITIAPVPLNPVQFAADDLAEFIRRTNEYLELERQLRRNKGEVMLNAVTVKAKRTEPQDPRKIYSSADATVKFDNLNTAGAISVFDVIRSRVAGVQVTGSGFNATVQIRGAANFGGAIEPLFVLDGMPVDKETLNSISVNDVDYVDVLKGASASIYGSRAAGGVIIVMTKRGNPNADVGKIAADGVLVAKLPGYAPVREFYAPRYDQPKPEHIRPDYRTTLHWQPLVVTDATGKATVSFYASDAKTTLNIVAEGATPDGKPGAGRAMVNVE